MTRFRRIVWEAPDGNLQARIRKCQGKWSTEHAEVQELRARLLNLQNWRCVYCQSLIELDEVGHRELEHVLPKSPSARCRRLNAMSNDVRKRRSTLGYPEFTFEPLNLAVSCKQCNTLKGMYDPLADRTQARPLKAYPDAAGLAWYHPQFSNYSDHISIDRNFLFTGKTDGGKAVVKECGLDRTEVLEKKFLARAKARARSAVTLRDVVDNLLTGIRSEVFSEVYAQRALAGECSISEKEAGLLLSLAETARTAAELEALARAYAGCKRRAVV